MTDILEQLKTQIETREKHCKEAESEARIIRIREVYYGKPFNILHDNGLI